MADRNLVIAAVVEDSAAKADIFAALDEIVDPLGDSHVEHVSHPDPQPGYGSGRTVSSACSFFNPVRMMPLIGVVTSPKTSPEVTEAATDFVASALGEQVISSQDPCGVRRQRTPDSLSEVGEQGA